MTIFDIIKQEVGLYHLCEDVRTFNSKDWESHSNENPIKETDKIRVYHGFSQFRNGLLAAKYGITGKERAKRVYSYESGNNPKGLFVTTDFKVAKEFSSGTPFVIVEFDTLYNNLESPTWVGGRGYYVQGEYTQSFKSGDERTAQMMQNRERAKDFDMDRGIREYENLIRE